MKTAIRVMGLLLGALLLVGVAAALILPQLIDPALVRDRVAALVKEHTGRELVIAGDIGWTVFPWLGVEVADVRLANAAGFGEQPFAQVAAVQARVKLLPLLRKEVEMSTVLLEGLAVNLVKTKDGRGNWEDLTAASSKTKADKVPAADTATAGAMPIAALAIGGVSIRNASLSWDDRAAGTQQAIDKLNLNLGEIRPGQPVAVTLEFIATGGTPPLASTVTLSGQVTPTQDYKQVTVRDLELNIVAVGDSLPGGRQEARLTAQAQYALDKGALELKDVVLNAVQQTLRGQLQGQLQGAAAPRFNGSFKLDRSSPRALLQALGQAAPETHDKTVLEKFEAGFDLQASADSLQLSKLTVLLDDTRMSGNLGVKSFARPAIDFKLALDTLDLDRYLPTPDPHAAQAEDEDDIEPAPAAQGKPVAPPAASPGKKKVAPLFPVETLRALNLNGDVTIATLKAYQLRSSDVVISVSAKDGLVQLYPARAKMYQGSYTGNIKLDVRGKKPRIAMDEKLTGVQAEPLLKDMLGEAKVTGRADIALKLTGVGNQPRSIRKTLNGNASFAFSDGVIKGLDVLGEIRQAYALLRGKPQTGVAKQTEFSAISGTATVTNGLVSNPDLLGKSPLLQVEGAGTAHLVTEQLDYRVNATLVDSLEGKGELTGRPIPVHISGSFAQPKVRVDLEQVLKQEAKQQLEKKLQDTLQDKLKGDALKGLFGR